MTVQRTRQVAYCITTRCWPIVKGIKTRIHTSEFSLKSRDLSLPCWSRRQHRRMHALSPPTDKWNVVHEHHFDQLGDLFPPTWKDRVDQFQQDRGCTFANRGVLYRALTHPSFIGMIQTDPEKELALEFPLERLCNRNLETLGDSILSMIVVSHLFQTGVCSQEQITLFKNNLTKNETLSRICCQPPLEMSELILVGSGFQENGREEMQAGAVESLIAAIFLDQGLDAATRFVLQYILLELEKLSETVSFDNVPLRDPITQLQVCTLTSHACLPDYHKKAPGCIAVYLGPEQLSEAQSTSFKKAKLKAAQMALERLDKLNRVSEKMGLGTVPLRDPISRLHVRTQVSHGCFPRYHKRAPGCIAVYLGHEELAEAQSDSFKNAKRKAAEMALKHLDELNKV